MNFSKGTAKPIKTNMVLLYVVYLLILVILFLAGAEFFLRSNEVNPWRKYDISINVYPGGKFFRRHPALGYTHIPGRFSVTFGSGYTFNVTHLSNTLRITHPVGNKKGANNKEEIWVFGCSFTHGWSINDEETYPWLLQERFPEYNIINFGVSGYGTIHSLTQFRDALKTTTPKVAILAYASFHDARNTFSRNRRKAIAPWNKLGPLIQPFARIDNDGKLQYLFADVEYSEFPMMSYLSLAHFIELKYNQLETKWLRSKSVSEELVMEMARLAEKHNVTFILANISGGREMLDFAEKNNISSIDISVDLSLPENVNHSHSNHPSLIANQKYANKLQRYLKVDLLK